jgi:D-sedoheptulose 7-phosphate isomerase
MIKEYADKIAEAVKRTDEVDKVEAVVALLRHTHDSGRTVYLIGNGGSAAMASHFAIDLTKNAVVRAMALNDAAALTCLGNDYGYQSVFEPQLFMHAARGDVLIAISSSGMSMNIRSAVGAAKDIGMTVVTLTGFRSENIVRTQGDINFHTPADTYGVVETAHHTILHFIVDRLCEMRLQKNS